MRAVVVVVFGILGFAAGLLLRPHPVPLFDVASVEALIEELRASDITRRAEAAEKLRAITGLNLDYNPFGREEEIEAGGRRWRRGGEDARSKSPPQWLADALLDRCYRHRADVALRIGARGYRECVGALIEALSDADPRVRAACANALGQLRDERALRPLARLLSDPVSSVANAAALALGRFGKKGALAVLSALEAISEPPALQTAADVLLAHNLNAAPALLRLLHSDTHSKLFALDRIRRCRIKSLKDEVARLTEDPSPSVKKAALATLSALEEKE